MDSNIFVGRYEHMQEDYKRLVGMLASRNALTQEPDAHLSLIHSTPAEYDGFRHLSERARANLQHWFVKDYELLDRFAAHGLVPEAYPTEVRASDEEVYPALPVNWLLFRTTWMLAAYLCVVVAGLAVLGLLATDVAKGCEGWIRLFFLGLFLVSGLLLGLCGVMVMILQ
jgi:hypothetical protein